MNQYIKIVLGIAFIGGFAVLMSWQLHSGQKQKEKEAAEAQEPIVITVEPFRVQFQKVSGGFSVQGITQPIQEVVVASEATGKISRSYVKEGDVVKTGDIICRVDATLREIELKTAVVQYEKAKRDYEKYTQLQKSNNVSTAEVENSLLQMKQLEYSVQSIQQMMKESSVYAPFAGTVTEKIAGLGGYLQLGTPVVALADVSKLKAELMVEEKSVSLIKTEDLVRLQLETMPDKTIQGIVTFVNVKSNEGGKYQVYVEFPNTFSAKAGMMVGAFFQEDKFIERLLIPKSALALNSATPAVYVLDGSVPHLQKIALGSSYQNQVEVKEGLSPGIWIVARGTENVTEGIELRIKSSILNK